jgi:arylsulfatase A-like enzyme
MKASRREFLRAGLAAGLFGSTACRGSRLPRERPPVLLITLDTTRADRLGCYGYARATSPSLDRLSADSVLYSRAIATSSWTLPSHASMFTGKFTSSHGARYDAEGPLRLGDAISGPWNQYRARGLSPEERTLAAILKEAGYATGAVVGGPWMKKVFGLAAGFDHYDDERIGDVNGRLASEITPAALTWVESQRSQPFFLFLNYFDPHGPYAPPEPFASAFLPTGRRAVGEETPGPEEIQASYDAEILYMDHHLGKLLERFKALDLYDSTLIVATADHGELLGEHGRMGHGESLSEPELHVPFLVKYPAGEKAPGRSDAPVQTLDVFALILERLGLPRPPEAQAGVPPAVGHPLVAEVETLPFASPDGDWRALYDKHHKFLWNSKGNHQLFDLEVDPGEEVNLVARAPERAKKMDELLNRYLASLPRPGAAGPPAALDEETLRTLKSLGYVR